MKKGTKKAATGRQWNRIIVTNGDWGEGASNKVQRILREELRHHDQACEHDRWGELTMFLHDHIQFGIDHVRIGVTIACYCTDEELQALLVGCWRHWPKAQVWHVGMDGVLEAKPVPEGELPSFQKKKKALRIG